MQNDFLKTLIDGKVEVALKSGLKVDGVQVSSLTMREPEVADQLAAFAFKGSEPEREVLLFANLCNVSPDQIKSLKMRDYNRLQAAYRGFID